MFVTISGIGINGSTKKPPDLAVRGFPWLLLFASAKRAPPRGPNNNDDVRDDLRHWYQRLHKKTPEPCGAGVLVTKGSELDRRSPPRRSNNNHPVAGNRGFGDVPKHGFHDQYCLYKEFGMNLYNRQRKITDRTVLVNPFFDRKPLSRFCPLVSGSYSSASRSTKRRSNSGPMVGKALDSKSIVAWMSCIEATSIGPWV